MVTSIPIVSVTMTIVGVASCCVGGEGGGGDVSGRSISGDVCGGNSMMWEEMEDGSE